MFKTIVLQKAGTSVRATLPKQMVERLQMAAGDRLLATETDQGILLTPISPSDADALRVAEAMAVRHREALRKLAD